MLALAFALAFVTFEMVMTGAATACWGKWCATRLASCAARIATSRISPQCLHFLATARTCSPQNGQAEVSGTGAGTAAITWGRLGTAATLGDLTGGRTAGNGGGADAPGTTIRCPQPAHFTLAGVGIFDAKRFLAMRTLELNHTDLPFCFLIDQWKIRTEPSDPSRVFHLWGSANWLKQPKEKGAQTKAAPETPTKGHYATAQGPTLPFGSVVQALLA